MKLRRLRLPAIDLRMNRDAVIPDRTTSMYASRGRVAAVSATLAGVLTVPLGGPASAQSPAEDAQAMLNDSALQESESNGEIPFVVYFNAGAGAPSGAVLYQPAPITDVVSRLSASPACTGTLYVRGAYAYRKTPVATTYESGRTAIEVECDGAVVSQTFSSVLLTDEGLPVIGQPIATYAEAYDEPAFTSQEVGLWSQWGGFHGTGSDLKWRHQASFKTEFGQVGIICIDAFLTQGVSRSTVYRPCGGT